MPAEKFSEADITEITDKVLNKIETDQELAARLTWIVTKVLVTHPDLGSALIDGLQDKFPQSVLSGDEIRKGREEGWIVIEPFDDKRVQTSSYDVSMGEYTWTTRPSSHPGRKIFNPYNPDHVTRLWKGPERAKTVREYLKISEWECTEDDFRGLKVDDPIKILRPGETILAHTDEFIGGKDKATSMMKARSSWGRVFLAVCKDAGWGDVGYYNRWTMEIQNNLQDEWSVVGVQQPIAQIVFFRTNPSIESYSNSGNYQTTQNLQTMMDSWTPEQMLPRLKRK